MAALTALTLLAAVGVAAPDQGEAGGGMPIARASSTAAAPTLVEQGVGFGAYVPPAPWSGMRPVTELETALGTSLDVVHVFQAWGNDWGAFDAERLEAIAAGGRKALVTWEPWVAGDPGGAAADQPEYRLARIARGDFDGYVRDWARQARQYGERLYLRPMQEMNGTWYPWAGRANGNAPEEYTAAWRHLHRIFTEEGADNVRWVWSPLADDVPADNAFEQYWPGGDVVDVLALDGYNWGAEMPEHGGWRTFDEVFADAYARITALGDQPVWITEVGADPVGGDKARWLADMFADRDYPRLETIVWYHQDKERNWRLDAPPAALEVVADALAARPGRGGDAGDGASDTARRTGAPAAFDGDPATTAELGTDDPVSTAIELSQVRFPSGGADSVVLAREDAYPDALAAGGLLSEAPLLLTAGDHLTEAVRAELARVLAEGATVYLLGGEQALGAEIAEALAAEGYTPRRLAGATRVETAIAVAEELARLRPAEEVLLARADGPPDAAWADAVAGGAYAARTATPVLLTPGAQLHEAADAAISALDPERVILLGGEQALSRAVADRLQAPLRVAGGDRAATAAAIAEQLWPQRAPARHTLINGYVANGWAFGLAAAGLASDADAPLLLAAAETIPDATAAAIARAGGSEDVEIALVGGERGLEPRVRAALEAIE